MAGANVCQIVTDRIIAELEKGNIPWQKPWTGVRSGAYSRATGRPYSLLNQMLLGRPGEYLTYRQASEAGGHVREGEHGHLVVFWKMLPTQKTKDDGTIEKVIIPLLKYYHVFHIDQCEGIEAKWKPEDLLPIDPISEADAVLTGYSTRSGCPIIHEKIDEAYYTSRDEIHLPLMEQFLSSEVYYSVAFHEAIHSTGHKSRLNRTMGTGFGSKAYSKEELIAEIGAATIMNELGLETSGTFKNSAAYIESWLRELRNDNKMIIYAAGKAEKAVRMIMGVDQDEAQDAVA